MLFEEGPGLNTMSLLESKTPQVLYRYLKNEVDNRILNFNNNL